MSRQRMEDLRAELASNGWRLLGEGEYARASTDPYALEREAIVWGLVGGDSSTVVELQFHAFGDLGQRTEKLTDIHYCEVTHTGERLYFDKRQNPEWRENRVRFVHGLNVRRFHR